MIDFYVVTERYKVVVAGFAQEIVRRSSAYNLHIQQYMRANPDGDVKSRFADESKQRVKSMVDNLNPNVSNINIMVGNVAWTCVHLPECESEFFQRFSPRLWSHL